MLYVRLKLKEEKHDEQKNFFFSSNGGGGILDAAPRTPSSAAWRLTSTRRLRFVATWIDSATKVTPRANENTLNSISPGFYPWYGISKTLNFDYLDDPQDNIYQTFDCVLASYLEGEGGL